MEELNQVFLEYIKEFKKLDTNKKREEVITSVKDFMRAVEMLAQHDGIQLHYLKKVEVDDLKNDHVTEDDYLEALIVYIEAVKNMLGEYLSYKQ